MATKTSDIYEVAHARIEHWQRSGSADVASFVESHPPVRELKSLLLDLIYEEYCLDCAASRTPRIADHVRRYPQFQESIQRLVEVHSLLENELGGRDEQPVVWPVVGDEVAGLQIISYLGRGSFSRVFLAQEIDLGHRIIVAKFTASLNGEASMLGRLEHPNITPIWWVKDVPDIGLQVIAMPLWGTASVLDLLDQTRSCSEYPERTAEVLVPATMPPAQFDSDWLPPRIPAMGPHTAGNYTDFVLNLGRELADALHYVHSRGIIHRDLKPSNILLTWSGRPFLVDFNLANARDQQSVLDGGTLAYMAPERLRRIQMRDNAANHWDSAEDVYSLGVVLYELLAGRSSLSIDYDQEPSTVIPQLLQPDRFQEWHSWLGVTVKRTIMGCLDEDPRRRPSAEQLRKNLRQCISPAEQFQRYCRRHPRRALIACGTASVLGASAAALWITTPSAAERAKAAGQRQYDAGEYELARQSFTQVMDWEGPSAHMLFARGQCQLALANYLMACEDFRRVRDFYPSPSLDLMAEECLGFSHIRLHNFGAAVAHYKTVLEADEHHLRALNNFAYSWVHCSMHESALFYLNKAIDEAPQMPMLHEHRARILLAISVKTNSPVSELAYEDQQFAINSGLATPLLFSEAAIVLLRREKQTPELQQQALRYLEKAVDLGCPPRDLYRDTSFAAISHLPGYAELANRPRGSQTRDSETELTLPPPKSLRLDDKD